MKNLKTFGQFNSEAVNEGWKENVLGGLMLLFGLVASGQSKQDKESGYRYVKTKSEAAMKDYLRQGYTLDSTAVDTVWQKLREEAPETKVMVIRLELSNDQFFESGRFRLNEYMKNDINNTIEEIVNSGGLVVKTEIESSTDKQRLTTKLQDELKSLGYSPDNNGLSKARSESISKYLIEYGINDTLIEVNTLAERGGGEIGTGIDQSARYVTVDFYYVVKKEEIDSITNNPQDYKIKKNFYLSKPLSNIETKNVNKKSKSNTHKKNIGTVNNIKYRKELSCTKKSNHTKWINRGLGK